MRRLAMLWLFAGWSAFLLLASLQVCCKLSAAKHEPVAAGTAIHISADISHTNHEPAEHQAVCADALLAAGVAIAAPERANYDGDTLAAYAAPESLGVRGTEYVVDRCWPPPHPTSFHRRTSRILI